MYNIYFCKIMERNGEELAGIGGLEYIKLLYEDIKAEDLKDYAELIAKESGNELKKIIKNQYGLFKNNDYCLFFEEIEESEENNGKK